ncbi:hypothetical protein [Ralstonia insidiosa]|jgi:positive regulator of sigma E activity|nr:hypothetical protein [Ralstonia insidiosa]MBA9940871.1 hypothetical protein [Ralstonia insidiosa]MBC9969075.1 hypothetical protein [Ralstonia insidiosa]MBX3905302.1 hypothetical protein [Ralstonia insidiosa]
MITPSLLELFGVDTSSSFLMLFERPGLALGALACSLLYVAFWLFVRYRKRVAIRFRWPTFLGCLAIGLVPYLANEVAVADAYRQLGQIQILTQSMTVGRAYDVVCSFDRAKLAPDSLDRARLTLADKSLRWRKAQTADVISSDQWAAQPDQCTFMPIPDTHRESQNLYAAGRATIWLQVAIYVAAAYGLWVLLTFSAASLAFGQIAGNTGGATSSSDIFVSKAEAITMAVVGTLLGWLYVLPFARLLARAKPSNR